MQVTCDCSKVGLIVKAFLFHVTCAEVLALWTAASLETAPRGGVVMRDSDGRHADIYVAWRAPILVRLAVWCGLPSPQS